jgi:hypothetical protein
MSANDTQVGGDHYRQAGEEKEQHWDRAARLFGAGYFQGQITKYTERAFLKGQAASDLRKAAHFATKLAELIEAGLIVPTNSADPHYRSEAVPSTRVAIRKAVKTVVTGRKK